MISDVDLRDWDRSIKAARQAVGDMDDYAIMNVGLNPIGARNFLNSFIEKVEALVYSDEKQVAALFKEKS